MKLALVTDAWQPQVNGVVTTLVELVREMEALGHQVEVIHPDLFSTRPCPGYAGIHLAVRPAKSLALQLDAIALKLNTRPRKTLNFETPSARLAASAASTG